MKNNEKLKGVLITGGAGFIGSHLCELFLQNGYSIQCLDNLSTGRYSNIQHLEGNEQFSFIRADVGDTLVLDRLASGVDIIVHLAAAVGVKLIVEKPVQTIETNINGTEVVLKTALKYNCRVIIASTSEVYGKGMKVPFKEDDDVLLGPTSKNRWAYAASKMVDEFLGLAYYHEYGLPVTSLRFFNTVGPRQTGHYGMVVPRFVTSALKGEPIQVYGDGEQKRCFAHVVDVVDAIYKVVIKGNCDGGVLNIGSTEEISIMNLAKKVKQLTNGKSDIELVPYEQAYSPGFEDLRRRIPDTTNLTQKIDWKTTKTIEDIIKDVIVYETEAMGPTNQAQAI